MSASPTSDFPARLLRFLQTFPLPDAAALPAGVEARSPYREPVAAALLGQFARRFYAADRPRVAVLGINPGRLGGGRTGVAFTDPFALADACGIAHDLPRKSPELSSQFMYQMIGALGGPAEFYRHFYVGSVYPLVLLRQGLNCNYYDYPALTQALWPALRDSLTRQAAELNLRPDVAVSLGRRNGEFLAKLNDELGLFKKLVSLDHPRFLMQYRRRFLAENVAAYVATLGELIT